MFIGANNQRFGGFTNLIISQFDLGCQEWLRALAGTLNSVGTLLVLPITGYVSDRWGRRVALVISVFNMAVFGLIRAFSINYPMYLALQIIQTTLGAGTFSSAYIFGKLIFSNIEYTCVKIWIEVCSSFTQEQLK